MSNRAYYCRATGRVEEAKRLEQARRAIPANDPHDPDYRRLYYVLGDGKAVRYGIGVGREGFTWTGVERVSRMAEWPDWHPPAEMI